MDSIADFWADAEIISAYSRADALRDGVLIEVPGKLGQELGIRVPVAVTASVWDGYISPPYLSDLPGQDVQGRLWDLLWMFVLSARQARSTDTVHFRVIFITLRATPGRSIDSGTWRMSHETVPLKAVCGPGDDGEPVITIMLPGED